MLRKRLSPARLVLNHYEIIKHRALILVLERKARTNLAFNRAGLHVELLASVSARFG